MKQLVPAWTLSFGGEKQRGQESQPLVSDGTLYVTASYSRMFAVDARTGEEKWQYDARLPDGILPCCDVVNRGAAIYGDKVYFTTLDAQLVALNKDTGKVVWRKKMEDFQDGYSNTAAPLVVKGKVIVGNSGGEFGIVGAVKAYDAETGEEVWYRPTVEGNMGRRRRQGFHDHRHDQRDLARRHVADMAVRPPGSAAPTIRSSTCCSSAPASRRPGTAGCDRATISTAPRRWPSIRTAARSSGTSRARRTTAGTSTASTSSSRSSSRRTARRSMPAPRPIATASSSCSTGPTASSSAPRRSSPRSPGPRVMATMAGRSPIRRRGRRAPTERRPGQGARLGVQRARASSAPRTGCRWPTARRPACSTCPATSGAWTSGTRTSAYKKGAAYLGAGFNIKPLYDDHIGVLRAIDPATGKIKFEVNNRRRCGAAC